MAWPESWAVRSFVRLALNEAVPDDSMISRTRRLIDMDTSRRVHLGAAVADRGRPAEGQERRDPRDDAEPTRDA